MWDSIKNTKLGRHWSLKMTSREKLIVRMALSYMMANLEDVFGPDGFDVYEKEDGEFYIDYHGQNIDCPINEEEIDELCKRLS